MTRYLNILKIFWGASLAQEMEYRTNFALAAVSSLIALGGAVFVLWNLYRTGYEMGGWSAWQALCVVGVYTLLDGIQRTVMQPNRSQITELVRQGTLDFVLLKPVDAQFWLSVRRLSVWGLPDIVLGVALVVIAGLNFDAPATVRDFIWMLPWLLCGLVILYAIGYLLATVTIWFVKAENITLAMSALLETGRYPIPAYPLAYRVFFTAVIPVAFMTTVPAQSLMGEARPWQLLMSLFVAVGLLAASRWFWQFALRFYTSASS